MLQSLALSLYRNPLAQACIRSPLGERVFEEAYFFYKRTLEAREARYLREFTRSDSWIVDIGANIGFFSVMFAGWLDRGKVLAIEPEPENFRRLQKVIAARGLDARVEPRQVAVGEAKGMGHLVVSKESHADHRLGDDGTPVAVETLDGIWQELGEPGVCLIKIDVQGGECGVLAGSKGLLKTCKPALYVEIDAAGDVGHPRALLSMLDALGYQPNAWRDKWAAITREEAVAAAERSPARYTDCLFLPK
jgi:FkbM family methyltransferase